MSDLAFKSATELAQLIQKKELSSEELTRHYIERIDRLDGKTNAVPVRIFERGIEDAKKADKMLAQGLIQGPLHGIPMTIKESYVLADTPATWGIDAYKDNVAEQDGLHVTRFRSAGAHFIGKTNVPVDLSDFQSYNPIYGTTNNPWDLEKTPGGSSGGSAAAMAAGFSGLEAGSDIGGSIRTPAHFCGVYGHKPTWGIVPQSGHELVSGVPDPDVSVCGPLARSADDLKLALDTMAGPTARESIGWRLDLAPPGFTSLQDLKVAIWATDDLAPVDDQIANKVTMVGDVLSKLGAVVSDTARPEIDLKKAHRVYQTLTQATMASGQPAHRIAEYQKFVNQLSDADDSEAAVSARAAVMSHRQWIRDDFRRANLQRAWDKFFEEWDVIICPQMAVTAFNHDHRPWKERTLLVNGEKQSYTKHLFWSGLANAPYLPSTIFPTGLSDTGLPIGIQVTSASYRDYKTIEFARLIAEEIGGFIPPPL